VRCARGRRRAPRTPPWSSLQAIHRVVRARRDPRPDAAAAPAGRRPQAGLGNTGILEQALASGAVDLYPEYTGTIVRELLSRDGNPFARRAEPLARAAALKAAIPFGFNNTYALAMTRAKAEALGIAASPTCSSRRRARSRSASRTSSCSAPTAGPPCARRTARVPASRSASITASPTTPSPQGRVDVIDVYSTDAKLGRLGLTVLDDDLGFFPKYDAVVLMRADVDAAPLARLAGSIDAATMIAMNGEVELDGRSFAETGEEVPRRRLRDGVGGERRGGASASGAAGASGRRGARAGAAPASLVERVFAPDFARLAGEHLLLVLASLALALVVGVPLGVAAWRWPRSEPLVLGAVALLQTIPSLALLAFLIALVGAIGVVPAVLALFLYALLPIVRNTHAGLQSVSGGMAQAALSLGMTARQALRHVQLPLAAPTLVAGVKTAAVINVGTRRWPRSSAPAGSASESSPASPSTTAASCSPARCRRRRSRSSSRVPSISPSAGLDTAAALDHATRARPRARYRASTPPARAPSTPLRQLRCISTGWFPRSSHSSSASLSGSRCAGRRSIRASSARRGSCATRSSAAPRERARSSSRRSGDVQRTLLAQQNDTARTQNEQIDSFSRQLAALQQHLAESLVQATSAQVEQARLARDSLDATQARKACARRRR
jgi:osmoprotectant transport system permease protein